jgi:hypothetical protein
MNSNENKYNFTDLIVPGIMIIIIVSLIIYLKFYKIPVWCVACENEGYFTKCVDGTGKGTLTCELCNKLYDEEQQIIQKLNIIKSDIFNLVTLIDAPIETIKKSISNLEDLFTKISINIPSIDKIEIPHIPAFSCNIDFTKIPSFDPCKLAGEAITKIINPINDDIKKIENQLNSFSNEVNKALKSIPGNLSVPQIKLKSLTDDLNTWSCSINIGTMISNVIGNTFDICKLTTEGINSIINLLNATLKIVKEGINIAITGINAALLLIIQSIQTSIMKAISILTDQLQVFTVFGKIIEKINSIISVLKSIDIISIIKCYILPFINTIFPSLSIMDLLLIIIILFTMPFILNIVMILANIINIILFFF